MASAPATDDGTEQPPRGWHGRIDHARARAEEAAARYRELARRDPVYALPIVAPDDLRRPSGHAAGQRDRHFAPSSG